ncbi:MAG: replication-relaxation family protein [Anaerolineae bacterium]|nr:replication-relaxation family protein [Anaerolineae bacterium]
MGFRLSQNDLPLLKVVNDCQALTIQQLITWRWNSANPAYTRVRQLVQEGYLERHFVTMVAATPMAATQVLTISPLGAAVLARTYGYDESSIYFASPQISNWKTLQTLLATNDFRVALLRACADHPEHEVVEWRNEAVFRAKPIYVSVNGKEKRKPLFPDGFFILQHAGRRSYNFVECDNGTETYAQFRGQMEVYQSYIASGLHQENFGVKSLNVLVVTTTPQRRDRLQQVTAQIGGGQRYRFTTYEQATPQTVLTSPIWQRIGEDEAQSLI